MPELPNPIVPGLYTTGSGCPVLVYSVSDDPNDEYPAKAITLGRSGVQFEDYTLIGRYASPYETALDLVAFVKPAAELPAEFAERVKNYLEASSTAANLSRILNSDLRSYATP